MIALDMSLECAKRIKCGYLNIRAVPGMKFDHPESYELIVNEIKNVSKQFEYHEVEGSHHVHLNNPERVAPIINNFVHSYSS